MFFHCLVYFTSAAVLAFFTVGGRIFLQALAKRSEYLNFFSSVMGPCVNL